MIIASSNLGMKSQRYYEAYSFTKLSMEDEHKEKQDELINEQESTCSYEGEEKKSEERRTITNQKRISTGKRFQVKTIHRIAQPDLKEEIKNLESIRQQCIVYLWACLFGESRAKQLADEYGMALPSSMQSGSFLNHQIIEDKGKEGDETADVIGDVHKENGEAHMAEGEPQITVLSPIGTKILVKGERVKGLTAVRETCYQEEETTTFSTTGTVKTADGRELSFQLNLNMSRTFTKYTKETANSMASFIDPLVINLNGNISQVTDQQFFFDLDADGKEERIARLSKDSGYLALDLNEDGKINDGKEMFGTTSGNGFNDLAKYDQDGNGWIDERDQVWNRLKIWVQREDGSDQLLSLKESGVGALCLGYADTNFIQRDSAGQVSAAIRNTGIFLYENGMAGTLQHLDLAQHSLLA